MDPVAASMAPTSKSRSFNQGRSTVLGISIWPVLLGGLVVNPALNVRCMLCRAPSLHQKLYTTRIYKCSEVVTQTTKKISPCSSHLDLKDLFHILIPHIVWHRLSSNSS